MKTIIDTATDAGKFSTLINALKAASLTETLRGKGPYTVFAPTDEAFKRLPAGSLNQLLKDTSKLKTNLQYHVVPGAIASRDLKAGDVKTVEGTPLAVACMEAGKVTVNGAKVVEADITASNGVIHAIDTVIMPKGTMLAAAA
jgi:uncharacterized surface protein with fasciclin (FAS1) repeats